MSTDLINSILKAEKEAENIRKNAEFDTLIVSVDPEEGILFIPIEFVDR